jgi:RNA polymerase sigma-70 factor (ECF subfamily)
MLRSRDDAEEAVQEAMLRGWRRASYCRNRWDPIPWLMTITRRECLRLASRGRERAELGERDGGVPCDDPCEAIAPAVDLRRAVARLSREEQALLKMRYAEQLTQPEIARVAGLPEGTVKIKLHRIRRRLRSELGV